MNTSPCFVAGVVLLAGALMDAKAAAPIQWERRVLTDKYYCDGIQRGDFNRDGQMDVVAGPFWYEGPTFQAAHEIYPPKEFPKPPSPTDSLYSFVHDFSGDGWPDVLVIGRVLFHQAFWYENPRGQTGHWKKHFVHERVQAESPAFADIDQDGRPEIVCIWQNQWGLLKPDPKGPAEPWAFHRITRETNWHHYYHGTGVGDVNSDGRPDLLLNDGWWERPPAVSGQTEWIAHRFKFAAKGGAQMFAYDVDGDGDNDIITSLDAHGWGLAWFEQVGEGGAAAFREHKIMGDRSEESRFGAAFSQPHALDLADLDGDGLQDIVVGKRVWAHGPKGDVEPDGAPVICWFRLTRGAGGQASFVPHLVDDQSGAGCQVVAADVTGDGRPDILTVSKLGAFVLVNGMPAGSAEPAMEKRIVFGPEMAGQWSAAESTVDASPRQGWASHPMLHWHIAVDHFGGEANYPVGWPRISCALRDPASRDWSAWDYLQLSIYAGTSRDALPREPVGLAIYTPDKNSAYQRILHELKKDAWTRIRIPIAELPRAQDVRLMQFHIADSHYRHQDQLDLYFEEIALVRYAQPAFLGFGPESRVMFADTAHVPVRFRLAGIAPGETLEVAFELRQGGRTAVRTTARLARGLQRIVLDLRGAQLSAGDCELSAGIAGGAARATAPLRLAPSPWQ